MALLKSGSLVSNIIQKSSTYDQKVLDENIERLRKKSAHLKGEIYELVKQHYVNFESYVDTTVTLEQRVQELRSEYQRLTKYIEQDLNNKIAQSQEKRGEAESKLEETQSRILLVQHLVDIYHAIENSRVDIQSGKYVVAAKNLSGAATALSATAREGCDAQVFQTLKSEYALVLSDLNLQLLEEWQKFVSWHPRAVSSEPSLDMLSRVEVHIPIFANSAQEDNKREVVQAMRLVSSMGVWEQRVELFAQKLLKLVIRPLIVHGSLQAHQSHSKGMIVIRMSNVADSKETSIFQLYDTLLGIFSILNHVVVKEHEKAWLQMIGDIICCEMEELMIAHRLSTSIPRIRSELEEYEEVIKKTKEFENQLAKMGYIQDGKMQKMSEYAENVNIHFVSQKSQEMLVEARSILMQPIHNTVAIATVDPVDSLKQILPIDASNIFDDVPDELYKGEISLVSFIFPSCTISLSVQDFVFHLYRTLEECFSAASPSGAVQLFYVARNMVDLFCAVMPSYHRKTLSDLPRMAAVQYNNCMYLAHHLITLGHQFHSKLPPPLNSQTTTFIDQVPLVRQLGEECFLTEIKKQSACILDFLKSFGGFSGVSHDQHREVVRHLLQGALLHINKLSKVYLEVLPTPMHHKAVGELLETLVSEIIQLILSMEDIAADDATELHSILNVVMEKGSPSLLLTTEESASESVATYCKNWKKLKELAVVMNASLLKIVELWDSGKGQLAREFSVSEVRGLIKALFKNTERRAAALSKIV